MLRSYNLQISTGEAGAAPTPQQKRFNTLIRQIEQARQNLAAWQDNIALYYDAHAQVLQPLQTEVIAARRQWVFVLADLHGRRGWTRAERDTLRELICGGAGELLDMCEDEDEEVKALYARHAGVDFDTERQEMVLELKSLTEAMTGLDLGDDEGMKTDADLFERVQQGLQGRAAAEEAERSAAGARRRKSAAQQRREAAAKQATQSVREIFRKLASALHPDRETDERERAVKTVLMQKVNQAYAANDLLTLLQLQLQIEQIDTAHLANVSAQRLTHYNHVLSEQLKELRAEIESVEMSFRIGAGLEAGLGMDPRKLGRLVEQHRRRLRAELTQTRHDMRTLADSAAVKPWLKRQRQLLRDADLDFAPF